MADTYIVVNKHHTQIGPDGPHRYEVGDEIEPTEAELKAFPDRFRKKDESRARRGPGRPPKEDSGETSDTHGLPLPQGAAVTPPPRL